MKFQRFPSFFLLSGLLALSTACRGEEPTSTDIVSKGCTENADCEGGRCIEGLPGGLCTSDCETQDDCPEGTLCTDTEATQGVCLIECSATSECTEHIGSGYVCDEETNFTTGEDIRVCIDE